MRQSPCDEGWQPALILLSVSVPHAQDNPDPFDPAAAVPKAWAIVTEAIEKGSVAEQLDAIRALAIACTPRALDLFERIVREGPPPVRKAAIWYLPQENRDKYLQLVLEAIQDPDLEVRREAIHGLRWFRGPRALLALQSAIMRSDADTIEYAVGSARLIGSSTFEVS